MIIMNNLLFVDSKYKYTLLKPCFTVVNFKTYKPDLNFTLEKLYMQMLHQL